MLFIWVCWAASNSVDGTQQHGHIFALYKAALLNTSWILTAVSRSAGNLAAAAPSTAFFFSRSAAISPVQAVLARNLALNVASK